VTADELRRYLDRTELGNGFANRFLWICVRRSKLLPEGGHLESVDFTPLIGRLNTALESIRRLGEVELRDEPESRTLWHEVYPRLSEGRPGLVGSVISRAEAQVRRLALVYALLDGSAVIRRVHLEAALEVWRYAEESALAVFGEALGDPTADRLLVLLQQVGADGCSRTEMSGHFARNLRAAELDRGLRALYDLGLALPRRARTGGRPEERWYVARQDESNERTEEGCGNDLPAEERAAGFLRSIRTCAAGQAVDLIQSETTLNASQGSSALGSVS
jgi:hypothetical protein